MDDTPELFHGDHFAVEDLFDFSNDVGNAATLEDAIVAASDAVTDDSTAAEGSNPSSFADINTNFSGDLCVPCDDLAELEWLSNIVEEESLSSEDIQNLHLISGFKTRPEPNSRTPNPDLNHNSLVSTTDVVSACAKARSKRSRARTTSTCFWPHRDIIPDNSFTPETSELGGGHENQAPPLRPPKKLCNGGGGARKKNLASVSAAREFGSGSGGGDARRCMHCSTEKTPQWRTGPMGPKTLCNACGVRFKSGRLVPEYRPAASPTFTQTKHSNSHRKVMELRRQKEMMRAQEEFLNLRDHQMDRVDFDLTSDGDDFLIHQHIGPDFRQLI